MMNSLSLEMLCSIKTLVGHKLSHHQCAESYHLCNFLDDCELWKFHRSHAHFLGFLHVYGNKLQSCKGTLVPLLFKTLSFIDTESKPREVKVAS